MSFAILMDLKIIQASDSLGSNRVSDLKNLYRWLHETMRIEGKQLNPKEWCLYGTRRETPMQRWYNCGLYTFLFGLCFAKRYSLEIITWERIAAARCLLLLKLIDLEPKNAEPLLQGPVGTKYKQWVRHPFHYAGEALPNPDVFPDDAAYKEYFNDPRTSPTRPDSVDEDPVVDLMTPPKPFNSAASVDLITPEKNCTQPIVTTPNVDGDTGGTRKGKKGSQNSEPSSSKGNSTGNEGGDSPSPSKASSPSPAGDGGTGGEGNGGGGDENNPD
jgi:hypothetical protein